MDILLWQCLFLTISTVQLRKELSLARGLVKTRQINSLIERKVLTYYTTVVVSFSTSLIHLGIHTNNINIGCYILTKNIPRLQATERKRKP